MVEVVEQPAGERFTNKFAAILLKGIQRKELALPTGLNGFDQNYLKEALPGVNTDALEIQISKGAGDNQIIQIFSPEALVAQLTYRKDGKLVALANDPVNGIAKYEIDMRDAKSIMRTPVTALQVKPEDVEVHKMIQSGQSYIKQR